MKEIKSRDIVVKSSLRIKEKQYLDEIMLIFNHSSLNALPIFDYEDTLIGILSKEVVKNAVHYGLSQISRELLNQDYLIVSEKDKIDTFVKNKKSYYLVQNQYKNIVGIINQIDLINAYTISLQTRLMELETVFEHAPVGITSIDKTGIYTSYNPAAEKIIGIKKEKAIGRFLTDVVVHNGSLEVLRTGEAQKTKKITVGNKKFITTRTPIWDKEDIKGLVTVFQDISEIEHISEELDTVRKLNRQLEAIIHASYDGIIITDSNGEILRYNQAIETLFTSQILNVENNNIFNIFKSLKSEILARLLKEKKSLTITHVMESGANLIITVNPVFLENNLEYIVVNVRNITDLIHLRKRVEESKILTERYKEELSYYRRELKTHINFIGESSKMKQVLDLVKKVSKFDSTILILGESGTGKEVIMKLIHLNSLRSEGPLITVNCGAIPETLLESELFGYEKGAFTGAGQKGKPGMFELANNGTLFLDEISELPLTLQVKLLRVLQERELTRIGGTKSIPVDVRILAATNVLLEEKVENGQFREDLFFRLNVIPIVLPPLREREEDLIPLIEMVLKEFNELYNMSKKLSPSSYEILLNYKWPGNVRELRNIIERCFVLSEGDIINLKEIEFPLFSNREISNEQNIMDNDEIRPLKEAVMDFEKKLIGKAIEKYGNTYKAAEFLQVDQSTIVRKLQKIKGVKE